MKTHRRFHKILEQDDEFGKVFFSSNSWNFIYLIWGHEENNNKSLRIKVKAKTKENVSQITKHVAEIVSSQSWPKAKLYFSEYDINIFTSHLNF